MKRVRGVYQVPRVGVDGELLVVQAGTRTDTSWHRERIAILVAQVVAPPHPRDIVLARLLHLPTGKLEPHAYPDAADTANTQTERRRPLPRTRCQLVSLRVPEARKCQKPCIPVHMAVILGAPAFSYFFFLAKKKG